MTEHTTTIRVTSKDGTSIVYECRGTGSSLVLVHGTSSDHTRWSPLMPELEKHFTIYAIDRRGRGQSGDVEPYSIEREYEDIAALIDSIADPVNLLGHSYGAICSLEASLLTHNLRKLILYEPPIPTAVPRIFPPEAMEGVHKCLQSGKREDALLIFLRDIVEIPEKEITFLKSLPGWPARVATAPTIPREQAGCEAYVLKPLQFSRMETDTLLLLGGSSPAFYKEAIDALHAALPKSKIVVMPGQQHAAMNTAPDLFLAEIMEFLS